MMLFINKYHIQKMLSMHLPQQIEDFMNEYNSVYAGLLCQAFSRLQIPIETFSFVEHKRLLKCLLAIQSAQIDEHIKESIKNEIYTIQKENNLTILHRKSLVILLKARAHLSGIDTSNQMWQDIDKITSCIDQKIWDYALYYSTSIKLYGIEFNLSEDFINHKLKIIRNLQSIKSLSQWFSNVIIHILNKHECKKEEGKMRFLLGHSSISFNGFRTDVPVEKQIYINKLAAYKNLIETGNFHKVLYTMWD